MVSGDLGLQAPEKGRGERILHPANFCVSDKLVAKFGSQLTQFCRTQQSSSGACKCKAAQWPGNEAKPVFFP